MKLPKNQKAFLKTIKNDKARAEQKTQFKLQNKFDRRSVEIIFTDGQFKTNDPRIIEFLNSTPMFCNKVDDPKEESKSDFDTMQWGDRKKPQTLTKEALRDLTEPKVVETEQVKEESVAKKVIAERLESTKPTETVELKTYTKGNMKKCFWNSRNLLNDVRETIWEYPNFEQYLKSLK